MENPCKILCFGDSLTLRYATVFEQRFREKFPDIDATIVNAGVSGETSREALGRLPSILEEKPDGVVLGFGMNDLGKEGPRHVSQPEFESNLLQMIREIEGIGARVLLLTINPVAGRPDSAFNLSVDAYNNVIREVAQQTKVRLVDVHTMWKKELAPYKKGLEDDLHPNALGASLYAGAVLQVIARPNIIVLWQYNGNPCACNYKCPYCSYAGIQHGHHFQGTIEKWHDAFKAAFGNQHVAFYLAHGEPMLGKNFYEVLEMVGSEPNWEVRMTSNISLPLEPLVETRAAREGRLNVNASFHPHMVKRERFLKKALFLSEHGIEVPVVYVMYPPLLERFEDDFNFFNAHNFLVHVRRFRGEYQGKMYPEAYTDAELQFIARYCDDATIKYMLFNEPSYGKRTWSGVDFVIVDNQGNVGYCDDFRSDEYCLGNIFDNSFRLLTEPPLFPGRFVSDGTVDGVANFPELGYRQLTGNNVLNFARQGGVYHTANGVHYKNLHTDFNDSKVRAEYRFPARDFKDAIAILTNQNETPAKRLWRIAHSVFPDRANYQSQLAWGALLRISPLVRFARFARLARSCCRNLADVVQAEACYAYARTIGLYGHRFHAFGQRCAVSLLLKRDRGAAKEMLINPVSMFRYSEFEFAYTAGDWKQATRILDVSSPRLFSAYILARYANVALVITNPDKTDIALTKDLYSKCNLDKNRVEYHSATATELPFDTPCFDIIYSISVVEHVLQEQQQAFLEKLWCLLKPGGRLICTVPVACKHREEYRGEDLYSSGYPRDEHGQVFFQRVYDSNSLDRQVIQPIQSLEGSLVYMQVFGLKKGQSFDDYLRRMEQSGFREGFRDPLYAARSMTQYNSLDDLPDRGVCGMVFQKPPLGPE